jgi:hypothetical protein
MLVYRKVRCLWRECPTFAMRRLYRTRIAEIQKGLARSPSKYLLFPDDQEKGQVALLTSPIFDAELPGIGDAPNGKGAAGITQQRPFLETAAFDEVR